MKNYFTKPIAKAKSSIHSLIVVIALAMLSYQAAAQCTSGCTSSITTNSNFTVGAGQTVCLTYTGGNFTKTITLNGGTLCIGPGVHITGGSFSMSSASTINNYGSIATGFASFAAGYKIYNYGTLTGTMSVTGGAVENMSGGTFAPTATSFTSGSIINDAGGTATFLSPIVNSGFTLTNNGSMTFTGITNSGGTVNFTGTSQTVNGNVTNQGTFTLAGTLTITGNYSDNIAGTVKAVGTGATCNFLNVGGSFSNLSLGTFNGNNVGLTLSAIPNLPTRMTNGATGPVSAPSQQGSSLSLSATALTVSGGFTSPSASIAGFIVLRYIGGSAPVDNPTNGTLYSVGDAVGSSTVAAIVTGGSAGLKSFTDNVPSSSCGQNVYYRIFSYNGTQPCEVFYLTSPLTGNIAMTVPSATITAGGPTTFCVGGSVTLTAGGGISYLWSTAATSTSISPSTSGTYVVTATNTIGCTDTAISVVTVNSAGAITPYVNINGSGWVTNASPAVCLGGSLELGPQPLTGTWTFTGPSGFHSYQRDTLITNIQSSQAGTYTATYVNASNGCSNTQNYVVTVNALPTPSVNNATTCAGTPATLTATGGVSYVWSTGATTASISPSPGTTTTYTVTATNAAGCTATASGTITVNAIPSPSITPSGPTTFCAGGSVILTASGGTSYAWSNGKSTAADTITTSATYTVTVTNAASCTATANTVVTVNALPTPTVNNAVSCFGALDTLTATGGVSYVWSTTATTTSIITATAGTYTVTATNAAGCTATASGTITASSPTPSTNNPAVCVGATATMTATGGGTYLWSTGSTTDTICSVTAGVYSVTVTNTLGCSATASGIVTVNSLPTPSVNNGIICPGGTTTLTATGGSIYTWSNGATTTSITVSTPGTYTVTATNMGSCTATASGVASAGTNPSASATNGVTCSGVPAVITASGGTSYLWSTGATTASISVTVVGSYPVTVTNASGCTATASSSVTAAALPTPSVNSPTICVGQSASLTASGGVSYVWSTGATANPISVSPVTTTTYTVTATNAGGCTASVNSTVTVNSLPIPAATGGLICTGVPTDSASLTASGGTSYHWNTGSTNAILRTIVAGTYTVTVTNAAGCTATTSAVATSAAKPLPTVNSTSVCSGTTVTLTATNGTSYLWSTAATTTSISVSPATTTTYSVTATNAAGCTATASGTVTDYPLPTAAPGSNTPILLNGTINLTSSAASGTSPYTYSWSGPSSYTSIATNPSIASALPTNAGIYYLTVTDAHSCTVTGNTTVVMNYAAPGGLASNTALWLNANVGVSVSGSNVTAWADQSQLNNNVTTVNGTSPTLVTNSINSYPVINFAGAGGLQGAFGTAITSNAVTAFIVTNTSSSSVNSSGILSIVSAGSVDSTTVNSSPLFTRTTNALSTIRNNAIAGTYNNAAALGQYQLATTMFTAGGKDSFFVEGQKATTATYAATAFNATRYSIGSRLTTAACKYMTGQIAEVALFNRQVTNAERAQVESYLALKYGITLDQTNGQSYVASNGTVYWNYTTNGLYKYNIFGVGYDNVTALNQIKSVSLNTSILSINSATGLPDYSFLVVADSGGANTVSPASGLPNTINARLTNKWRASQTGGRVAANYVFNSSLMSFGNYAPISSLMTPYMLIDSNHDGVFETYVAASSVVGSNITFNVNMKDGALFTCGFKASIDYGDAWGVPTTNANNGAGHLIVPGVYLGSLIDAELDGQPSVNELGDDTIGVADEDGVDFNAGVATSVNIVTMGTNTIKVTASVPGYLNAWADFNQDNTYGGGSEYAIQNFHLAAGVNTVTFSVSDSVEYGPTSMRFRFDTILGDVTAATGLAKNGEVEDYQIYVTAPLVGACTNGFQNPGFEQGPDPAVNNYIITSETNLPYWRTTATDKQVEVWYNGFLGVPSHGGTYFVELEANLYGALYQDVYTTPGTKLQWSFAHRGRQGNDTATLNIGSPTNPIYQMTAIDGTSGWGVHSGFYTVPAGQYITRLEFLAVGSYGGNNSIGNFLDDVSVGSSFDYGDAPDTYKTLYASGGPYHSQTGVLYLGAGVSCDADGTPDANASADTYDDGITFPTACAACSTYTVNITAFNNSGQQATIAGWIDFNKNGVFETSERASVNIPSSASPQSTTMTFTVNAFSAASATTFARFRIANDSTEIATPGGLATSGEVEDYKVPCVAVPTPVPSASPNPVCARGPMSLSATGTAPFYQWTGPNSFTASSQNPTKSSVAFTDSGYYRVYAVYANGCETDSAVHVTVNNCYVNLSGNILDDANGNGLKDGSEVTSNRGKTVYIVLSSSTNTVLATSLAAANGSFSFSTVPAYTTGMTIEPSTTNPSVGAATPAASWPSNWVGTKNQYGSNNNAGSGTYSTANTLPVSVDIKDLTGQYLGYDQLPSSVAKSYTIPHPHHNSYFAITAANGLGTFSGSDPEDGSFTSGSTFTITSLAGLNGNQLFYDANGDGVLQSYEQITGYTVITNVDPTKFMIKFSGAGSKTAVFNYGSTDAAGNVDPAPATYTIKWNQALPVKLISFDAQKYEETQSIIKWATASEVNNDHFDIERSADAISWEKIGEQKGAGNSNDVINYSMIDPSPLQGANYYRLKQVDFDGNFEYSDIAEVDFSGGLNSSVTVLSMYPNPLSIGKGLNIKLAGSEDNIKEIVITNEMGQTVYKTNVTDTQNYEIQGLDMAAGIYMVNVVSQANKVLTGKIIVTK